MSTTPATPSGLCASSQRRLDALASRGGEKSGLAAWLTTPIYVDCVTTVMLKILDGKCKMSLEEKGVMERLYDQLKHLPGERLPGDIHTLIATARQQLSNGLIEKIYEQRLYAEQAITRPVMKGFKARLREEGYLATLPAQKNINSETAVTENSLASKSNPSVRSTPEETYE